MVKIILFRVYLRMSFVCVGAFTGNARVFLRATHASLCGGLRVAQTEVSGLRRLKFSGCGSGGTPNVAVKRSNGQMVNFSLCEHVCLNIYNNIIEIIYINIYYFYTLPPIHYPPKQQFYLFDRLTI